MAKQDINLGTPPGGSDGDTTRTAFVKTKQNFDELYTRAQGKLTKDIGGGAGVVVLTPEEALNGVILLTGALTGNKEVAVPATPPMAWVVRNVTTGAFTVRFRTVAGTGPLIAQGATDVMVSDGTDIIGTVAPALAAASAAQTAAANAQTAASNAQSTATAAQTAASNAQTTANGALQRSGGTVTGVVTFNAIPVAGTIRYGAYPIIYDAGSANLGVRTGTPGNERYFEFAWDGNARALNGSWINGSDERLKDNIAPIPDALARVRRLTGVQYNRKTDPHRVEVGLIAQDVLQQFPEVVSEGAYLVPLPEDIEGPPQRLTYLGVAYGNLVGALVEAVKTLANQVDTLQARLDDMTGAQQP